MALQVARARKGGGKDGQRSGCGMEVDEKKCGQVPAYGEDLLFCAPVCKRAFDEDPPSTSGLEGMKWPDMAVTKCSLGLLSTTLGRNGNLARSSINKALRTQSARHMEGEEEKVLHADIPCGISR